jgi:hypothetical protein
VITIDVLGGEDDGDKTCSFHCEEENRAAADFDSIRKEFKSESSQFKEGSETSNAQIQIPKK